MASSGSYKFKLATKILLEHFGPSVAALGSLLLKSASGLSLSNIVVNQGKTLRMPVRTIRDCLLVLCKHNMITFRKSTKENAILYHIEISKVLRRIRFPSAFELVQQEGIHLGVEVMQVVAKEGQCHLQRILSVLVSETCSSDSVHVAFDRLVQAKLLSPVTRFSELIISDERARECQVLGKRNFESTLSNVNSNSIDALFHINWEELMRRFRCGAIVQLIQQRLGALAAVVVEVILQNSSLHTESDGDNECIPMTVVDIFKALRARSEYVDMTDETLRDALNLLINDPIGNLEPSNIESESFSVNSKRICKYIKDLARQSIFLEKYGKMTSRILTALQNEGRIEQQRLSEITLIPAKETREILYRLYRDHLAVYFEVTRSTNSMSATGKTLYFWSIDEGKISLNLGESHYQAIFNLMVRRDSIEKDDQVLSLTRRKLVDNVFFKQNSSN